MLKAYGTYVLFCARVNVVPMTFEIWSLWEGTMQPEQQKDCPPRRKPRSLFDKRTSASFLDLQFPVLHRNQEGITYTVVGPR